MHEIDLLSKMCPLALLQIGLVSLATGEVTEIMGRWKVDQQANKQYTQTHTLNNPRNTIDRDHGTIKDRPASSTHKHTPSFTLVTLLINTHRYPLSINQYTHPMPHPITLHTLLMYPIIYLLIHQYTHPMHTQSRYTPS